MTKEQKQEFTRRIAQANKTELVIILYDIFLTYAQDALDAANQVDIGNYHTYIKRAKDTIAELMQSINPESSIAGNYRSLYGFMLRQLTRADSSKETELIRQIQTMVLSMKDAYKKVCEKDQSAPVMDNAQTVYAGLTYGRGELNENLEANANRGFLA